ncbi:unnamed protein product [Rhizopus stolonifer]
MLGAMNFCLLGGRYGTTINKMLMGLAHKLQLTIYEHLVRFNSTHHNSKSNNPIINDVDSFSENSKGPNKDKWSPLTYMSKEMKKKFELARDFMLTNEKANVDIINKLLDSNISEKDLQNMLNGPKILFTNLSDKKFLMKTITKTGKDFGSLAGIYIWTHIPSNQKYVGSAIHLPTRLRSYFLKTSNIGKLLPILNNSPLSEFSLEVKFTPYSNDFRNELVVEQYYLLDKSFNLNTIRVSNNPSGSNAKSLFMYNRDCSILYYSSLKQIDFVRELGKYLFSKEFIDTAQKVDLSRFDLLNMLEKDRVKFNINKPVNSLSTSVVLIDASTHSPSGKATRGLSDPGLRSSPGTQEKLFFLSLGSALRFLRDKGYRADQRTLVKRLDTNIEYYGYYCKKAPLK